MSTRKKSAIGHREEDVVIFIHWRVVSRVRNHGKHQNCPSDVDVWVSGGSGTQNMQGTQIGLSWFGLLSPTSSSIVFFMLGMCNWVITMVENKRNLQRFV
jgi:hypothetical protein